MTTTSTVPTDAGESATLEHGRFSTRYVDRGEGAVALLLHGSGPGVDAMANWRLVLPDLATDHRVIAPDIVGFGETRVEGEQIPDRAMWLEFLVSFMDALGLETVDVIGNSFGGALSLWLASEHPDRVRRIVLMGSVGSRFELTPGLDAVWGYEPSLDAMTELLEVFTHDASRLPPALARIRYEASAQAGSAERYSSLFPAPRQRWIDALALGPERLASLGQPTLIVHGREDRVIPLASSIQLEQSIADAVLHVFPFCGHWVQIERAHEFCALVRTHLDRPDEP